MIKSMTGYGHAAFDDGKVKISVEVRSLNSKFLDLMLRLPGKFTDREGEVRRLVGEQLERGKVAMTIDYQSEETQEIQRYNEELFVAYYGALKKLADRVYAPYDQLFELALSAPDVIQNPQSAKSDDAQWGVLSRTLVEALAACDHFRVAEGETLRGKFMEYAAAIEAHLKTVERLAPKRIDRIRARLMDDLSGLKLDSGFDKNRFEQELLFYVEKLDISEECVRLRSHLDYFNKELDGDRSAGKRLGFISQEIGREINTIGAKANDADIQKSVVLMKDELEKIKEQLGNVL